MKARRAAVRVLVATCTVLDRLGVDRITHRHRLANWSADLDERWGTGVWTAPAPHDRP